MSIVTITLCDRSFKLSCPEENKSKLLTLAEKLDSAVSDIKNNNSNISFELALVITALSLVDDKHSKAQETGGEVLEQANQDFQKLLVSITQELKTVAEKAEKC